MDGIFRRSLMGVDKKIMGYRSFERKYRKFSKIPGNIQNSGNITGTWKSPKMLRKNSMENSENILRIPENNFGKFTQVSETCLWYFGQSGTFSEFSLIPSWCKLFKIPYISSCIVIIVIRSSKFTVLTCGKSSSKPLLFESETVVIPMNRVKYT